MSEPDESQAVRDLQDDEADAFVASKDAIIREEYRDFIAARRVFSAIFKRSGEAGARAAFEAVLKEPKLTKGHAMNLMMHSLHDMLKADGVSNPTDLVARLFSGTGPLGGRDYESAVRRLRPSRQTKRMKST